ncbi:TetR/AcrR family transcriptional regulator [bacterium 210820-DFI.6.37]|nr:TetR/AcrR family transcriptional regulator [bacterium 210820-DFI.6.37]
MEAKKRHIFEAARGLFSEKGYLRTSMQDIAEGCNVSKATLYKLFGSKEELGIFVLLCMTVEMKEKVDQITEDPELFPREMFKQAIIARMEDYPERSRLISELLFSLAQEQREKYLPLINKNKFEIFEMFSKIIMQAFGLGSETMASELTLNLNGLLSEVTFVSREKFLELDEAAAADFMVDSLEAIMEKRRGKEPLMTKEQLQELRLFFHEEKQEMEKLFRRRRLMKNLHSVLDEYEKHGSRGKLQEAEGLLKELETL